MVGRLHGPNAWGEALRSEGCTDRPGGRRGGRGGHARLLAPGLDMCRSVRHPRGSHTQAGHPDGHPRDSHDQTGYPRDSHDRAPSGQPRSSRPPSGQPQSSGVESRSVRGGVRRQIPACVKLKAAAACLSAAIFPRRLFAALFRVLFRRQSVLCYQVSPRVAHT